MILATRTAMVQARVRPEIKYASARVLRKIGLTMTEAMELFLRRLIVDQKLPFEVAAVDDMTLTAIVSSWDVYKEKSIDLGVSKTFRSRRRQKRE